MSEIQGKNTVFVLREQAKILSANGRGGEYLDHAADKIEELESMIDDVLHELNVCSPLGDVHWVQLQERMEQVVGEKVKNRP